ncbi:hemin-degrading factor [Pleomorphovibrio marinus]|uniref:hemin-degrading factor n=1 Tax=Pleomorphovibrio marinus TaxID=2164132 RepID=UPI000E0A47FD|nr:ChuX/HutX family heme-like substrate-binding protein [Pleomorphovibrio marinus]
METEAKKMEISTLKKNWEKLKAENQAIRIRDAARALGVSEASLLCTSLGNGVTRLEGSWPEILLACKGLGKVMSLTRSEGCVLEHKGTFQKISLHGKAPQQIATVIGPIEQRVFFKAWKFGFAVTQTTPRGIMESLQFFDQEGTAVIKIFLQEKSNRDVYQQILNTYKHPTQSPYLEEIPFEEETYAKEIDKEAFAQDWEQMKDTHDFFGMLKKHKIQRLDALKWIGNKWAYQVDRLSVRKILDVASSTKLPIMIFAGNKGNIQIHQGKVRTIRQMGNWLNVMDPDFNMHLNEEVVETAWVVHKNTEDGIVSAIELFDEKGEIVAQFFGLRKPGLPQNEAWRKLVESL